LDLPGGRDWGRWYKVESGKGISITIEIFNNFNDFSFIPYHVCGEEKGPSLGQKLGKFNFMEEA
jgi:hypothetical protein